MSETATLSSKFRISIPKAIRTAHAWEAGLTFAFVSKGTGVLLVPVPKRDSLKGLDSSFKCNTQSPQGIGCCDGQTK